MYKKSITIYTEKKDITISTSKILYVLMDRNVAEVHVIGGEIYKTRMTLAELEKALGDGFVKVDRGCLVSAVAVHSIGKKICLINGEEISYVVRKKKEVRTKVLERQRHFIKGFKNSEIPKNTHEYNLYFHGFDELPIAFTDIEMVFNEENNAVDWIFRYANHALAELEQVPQDKLVGNLFSEIFSNMDSKWLKAYETTAIFGETLEFFDYSPEIDKHLHIICFPTFKGHCGCMLFDVSKVRFAESSDNSQHAWMIYFEKLLESKELKGK